MGIWQFEPDADVQPDEASVIKEKEGNKHER